MALKLCAPPGTPSVLADTYGAIIGLLADLPDDTTLPDVDSLGQVMSHPWAPATLDGIGRNRLGLAYLVWRLRNSRVLDLPAPSYRTSRTS